MSTDPYRSPKGFYDVVPDSPSQYPYVADKMPQTACPTSRKGDKLWTRFAAPGGHVEAAHPARLNAMLQDPARKLYEPRVVTNEGVTTQLAPIAERGVELYENFGLDEVADKSQSWNDTDEGQVINNGTPTAEWFSNYVQEKNAVNDGGRRVSLFGEVEYTVTTYGLFEPRVSNETAVTPSVGGTNVYGKSVVDVDWYACKQSTSSAVDYSAVSKYADGSNGINPQVPFISGWVIKLDYRRQNSATEYDYFGNSGAVFRVGTNTYTFGYNRARLADFPINATQTYSYRGMLYLLTYWANETLYIDAAFPTLIANIIGGELQTFPSNSVYPDSGLTVCPVAHGFDGNAADRVSGFKSMYVPPHMEVTATTQAVANVFRPTIGENEVYTYNSGYSVRLNDYNGSYGTYALQDYDAGNTVGLVTYPIRGESAALGNGAFHSFGQTDPNYTHAQYATAAHRGLENVVVPIYNCALVRIRVRVRRDQIFYGNYIAPASKSFCPEILMIPGFEHAADFTRATPNGAETEYSPMQLIADTTAFWKPDPSVIETEADYQRYLADAKANGGAAGNIYCTSTSQSPTFNSGVSPHDVIPAPQSALSTLALAPSRAFLQTYERLPEVAKGLLFAPAILASVPISLASSAQRMTAFPISNGIWSAEWTYVLWFCAMNGYSVTYNDDTSTYTYETQVADCRPCMLFVDRYYYDQRAGGVQSAASVFMQLYCAFKSMTVAYSKISDNGECQCTTTQALCGDMDAACGAPSPSSFIPDATVQNLCQNLAVNEICLMQVNQQTLTGGQNTFTGSQQCGDQPSAAPDSPAETDSSYLWIIILLAILIIVIIVVISQFGRIKKFVASRGQQ